jgi:hypothetical protein
MDRGANGTRRPGAPVTPPPGWPPEPHK